MHLTRQIGTVFRMTGSRCWWHLWINGHFMFIFKGTNLKFKSLTQLDSLCKGHWTVNVTRVTMRIVPMAPQIFSYREFTCQMTQNALKFTLLLVPRGFPQAVPCQWVSKGGIPRQACSWDTQDSADEYFALWTQELPCVTFLRTDYMVVWDAAMLTHLLFCFIF